MSMECADTNNVSDEILFAFSNITTIVVHNEANRKRKRLDRTCNCIICDEPIGMIGYQNHINGHIRESIEEDIAWRNNSAVGELVRKYRRRFQKLQAIVLGWVKR